MKKFIKKNKLNTFYFGCWLLIGCCTIYTEFAQAATTYQLSINKSGDGTVSSTDNSIICGGICNMNYNEGTKVTLNAVANTYSNFAGWSGACTGTAPSCTVTITAAKTVYALFTFQDPNSTKVLNVTKVGSGGVTSDYVGINCGGDCSEAYNMGTPITLTATPTIGYMFDKWSGVCPDLTAPVCSFPMSQNQTATAQFKVIPNTAVLQVYKAGGGTVTSAGVNCGTDCNEVYPLGSPVVLTATPTVGYSFQGWSGACTGTNSTCNIPSMDANKIVYALFKSNTATAHHMTVSAIGNGSVISNYAGINCISGMPPGSDCGEYYEAGRVITLTAKANPGSVFAKWVGECAGIASASCTLTMNSYKMPGAIFNIPPVAPVLNSPANGEVIPLQPMITLTWQAVSNADRYQLYLYHYITQEAIYLTYAADKIGCPLGSGAGILCTVTIPPNFNFPEGRMLWSVKAGDTDGVFGAGASRVFVIDSSPYTALLPPATTSLIPSAGMPVSGTYITFNWQDTGAKYFHIIVNDSMGKRIDVIKERTNLCSNSTCIFYSPILPMATGSASWQVRAWSPIKASTWTPLIKFNIN